MGNGEEALGSSRPLTPTLSPLRCAGVREEEDAWPEEAGHGAAPLGNIGYTEDDRSETCPTWEQREGCVGGVTLRWSCEHSCGFSGSR